MSDVTTNEQIDDLVADSVVEVAEGSVVDSTEEPAEDTRLRGAALLLREGDVAADYLEGLLDIVDLDGDIDIDVEGNRAMVSVVEGRAGDLQHLVGDGGKVLDALQELTRLAANRETGERSRLMLDIAGFRADRRAELVEIAGEAIAEAQRTEAPVRMAPMTPFERKVVHDAVAAAGLKSESEGEDSARRVVIRTA